MKVEQELKIYEYDGKDYGLYLATFRVFSDENSDAFIVIETRDHKYTLKASELRAAIDNATNTARHAR